MRHFHRKYSILCADKVKGSFKLPLFLLITLFCEKNINFLVSYFYILHAQNIKCPIIGDEKYGFGKQKNKKLQLFAVAIDASPVVKVELSSEEIQKMINF